MRLLASSVPVACLYVYKHHFGAITQQKKAISWPTSRNLGTRNIWLSLFLKSTVPSQIMRRTTWRWFMYWPGDPDSRPPQGNEGSPRTVRIINGVESREGEPLSKWALLMLFTIDRYFRLDQNRSRGQERKNGRVGEERTKKRRVKED